MRKILISLLLAASFGPATAATLQVTPLRALYDQPVHIRLSGLGPGDAVTLELDTTDGAGVAWQSRATFRADANGNVDLEKIRPAAGDYDSIDGMGLFLSMQPVGKPDASYRSPAAGKGSDERPPATYHLLARSQGRTVGRTTLLREQTAAGISITRIRRDGLVADLYVPAGVRGDGRRHSAVITLGGAEGGLAGGDAYARWLASHGFVALALGWYHLPGLNNDLIRVPVDTLTTNAIDYLSSLDFVDPQRIAAMGGSWGGIFALAAAAHTPRLRAVVSWVGSPLVYSGIGRDPKTGAFRNSNESPFTFDGKPVGFAGYPQIAKFLKTGDVDPVADAITPIWRISGPVLFIAGGDDQLGMSGPMARLGIKLLKQHHHAYGDHALIYPQAGHLIWPGYRPTFNQQKSPPGVPPVGGSPAGYARADVDCGPRVLAFLHHALDGGTASKAVTIN
ncbi:MAG: acyl-CoA thioesterase/bile acid-CoA:amino acid N-acyltransferase family protein [Gammaproteobacteria bacterium]|jgi:dienelactone hydrolase